MSLPIVFLYSGHGSQYYGMGRQFYDTEAEFRQVVDQGDQLVFERLGFSVKQELFSEQPKGKLFDQTLKTHPSIFIIQWAMTELLKSRGIMPKIVLGSSLGELTAMAVSGVFGFTDFLERACVEAQKMEEICQPGGMTAVLYDSQIFHDEPVFKNHVELAGINLPKNFIISGSFDGLGIVESFLSERGIFFQRLPVRHGFHSRLMDPFQDEIEALFKIYEIGKPKIDFWSCARAKQVDSVDFTLIWDVVRKPIQLMSTILELDRRGPFYYIDLSPSGVMATALKYILPKESQSKYDPIMSQFGKPLENLRKLLGQYGVTS